MTTRLRAVSLVVRNPAGEILVLEELTTKPHLGKYAGMLSIPMETCDPGQDYLTTLRQLHDEELAGLSSIRIPGQPVGVYRVAPKAWARLYTAESDTFQLPAASLDGHVDVRNHRWIRPELASTLWLRRGALEMIQDCVAGNRNVLRRHCSEVRAQEFVRA